MSAPGVAARLGISAQEVGERRAFLERVKKEIAVSLGHEAGSGTGNRTIALSVAS